MTEAQSESDHPQHQSLASTVKALQKHLARASAGDRAELRRLRPGHLEPPAFWKLMAGPLAEQSSRAANTTLWESREKNWALVVGAMARSGMPHDPSRGLGRVLAEAGVSELRLMKLLRASAEQLPAQVFAVVQLLASKGERTNWIDLAHVVLSCDRSDRETPRRKVARDYFSALG